MHTDYAVTQRDDNGMRHARCCRVSIIKCAGHSRASRFPPRFLRFWTRYGYSKTVYKPDAGDMKFDIAGNPNDPSSNVTIMQPGQSVRSRCPPVGRLLMLPKPCAPAADGMSHLFPVLPQY